MDEFKITRSKESLNSLLQHDRGVGGGPRVRGPEDSQRGLDDRPRMADEHPRGLADCSRGMNERRGIDDRQRGMDTRPHTLDDRVERMEMDQISRGQRKDDRPRGRDDHGRVGEERSCGMSGRGGGREGGEDERYGGGRGYGDEEDGRGRYHNSTW